MDKLSNLPPWALAGFVIGIGFLLVMMIFVTRFLYLCRPNEILILAGRNRKLADGRLVGYRVIFGGWAIKRPFVETVERMDMSLISVTMSMQGAYSKGGIPLSMHAVANIKISSEPGVVGNAIERFLGRNRAEIARVAKETLEGHLRGVVSGLTPEEVNEDRLAFAAKMKEESEDDLNKLGLHVDTLKIQHVSDERDYLESIGRKRIAEILREAEVAESDASRAAEESESVARARGEVAKTDSRAAVQAKTNELRQIRAELDAEARSEEERAKAAAEEARAVAEQELQRIRGELEQLRLEADVTIPAQVSRKVRELQAAGEAAKISADGEAQAQALSAIADAWAATKGRAMDMYILQHLDDIFGQVTRAAGRLDVGEVNLVDSGDGSTMPAFMASYPAAVTALLDQVSNTIGVDISRVLKGSGNGAPRGTNGASHDTPPAAPPPDGSTGIERRTV
ncbi:MAG TPA: SPFH domain-containing protein [Kofleriaceae bacterium]|nr:SPFH domain-containing protein [Kofleriaceae bacterium]